MKRIAYEDLALLPGICAEMVCSQPYTGQDISLEARSAAQVEKIEALRQQMDGQARFEFAEACDKRCRWAYDTRGVWFCEIARAKDNSGRDQLYIWLAHWLGAYLLDRETFLSRSSPPASK